MIFEIFRSKERQAQLVGQGAAKLKKAGLHHCGFVKSVERRTFYNQFVLAGMKLKSAVNALDFKAVARTYNGPGAVDVYAGRMQKAFDSL
jgi:N-acetylmuramidase